MTTGEKIAEERKNAGLTQRQLAEELGVTRQAVSRWESDLAFPETENLIAMSKLFGCSVDYLLNYKLGDQAKGGNGGEEDSDGGADGKASGGGFNLLKWSFEYKSKRTVCGLPLVHVNIGAGRVAKGFFAVGLVSHGIFSAGLLSMGVFSFGLLSLGLLALGELALGGFALGAIALGILSFGGVAVGLISFGGVAVGLMSFGGCSVGLFAMGGYANGRFIAVGGSAVGQIAIGETKAVGSRISVLKADFAQMKDEAFRLMDELPPFWRGFVNACKSFATSCMQ